MEYKFTSDQENYALYASGSVLYAVPGHPAFPIRLANEIFRRCMAYRKSWGVANRCVLFDPCCGSAYHLTTLAYFNWTDIAQIHASDIDADALSIAARNLSLLNLNGLERRIQELADMAQKFGKLSHATSLTHAGVLKQELASLVEDHNIQTRLFRADATDSQAVQAHWDGRAVDVVMTDVPYGRQSSWSFDTPPLETVDPVYALLDSLLPILQPDSVVAVTSAKKDKVRHERYKRLERFNVGKRQVALLRPLT